MNPWLRLAEAANEAEYNLICFPFAGGYAEYYLPWRSLLSNDFRLCPIQLPGRSMRWQEQQIVAMNVLQEVMIPALTSLLYEKPYFVFGHSMGGYIAYEFGRQIIQKGLPMPVGMMVSSIPAPRYWQGRSMVSAMSETDFYDFFIKLGGFPTELLKHESFITMQMNLMRNDIILCESCRYQTSAAFPFPLIAIGGDQDEYVQIDSMQAWADETASNLEFHKINGNHFYINDHGSLIIELIKKKMKQNVSLS